MCLGAEALYLCRQIVLVKASCTCRPERPLVHVFELVFSNRSSKVSFCLHLQQLHFSPSTFDADSNDCGCAVRLDAPVIHDWLSFSGDVSAEGGNARTFLLQLHKTSTSPNSVPEVNQRLRTSKSRSTFSMTDPLSVAAGVAGLISLGIQVSQSLVDFYNSHKDLDSDLDGTTKRLESLLDIFRYLEETISTRRFQADERDLVKNIEASISECDKLIDELQDECKKFSKTSSDGVKATIRIAGRRATYPFRKSTLQKIDEDIDEIRANLSSALGVLQLKDNKKTQIDVADIKTLLDLVKTNQISSSLCGWLKAPDATIDHNAACLKKHPGTGLWLIEDPRFSRWLIEENSILWLNGFAGSGKSVLCSTVIQFVLRHRRSDPRIGIAFFYFTFNDESKRDESGMLRALLLQLSTQLQDGHADLVRLYDSYKTGTPPSRVLIEHLRFLIERFQHVYIMLDALDESPRDGPRGHVLDALETMRRWALQGLHLFVTSRDERDIHEFFDLSTTQKVAMQNPGIDQDIANFVSGRLNTDRSLQKWRKHRDKIQETLARRAKGVYVGYQSKMAAVSMRCWLNLLQVSMG